MTSHTSADGRGGRLASIDCLRGIAVLAVLVHHMFRMSFPAQGWFFLLTYSDQLDLGARGVALFFVISGFCIHMPWARRKAAAGVERVDFFRFWKRRLWRLYPPYFFALTGGVLFVVFLAVMGKSGGVMPDYFAQAPQRLWKDYVVHLLMLHGLYPDFDKAGSNPPFWTLAREEYLYLMYFALLAWRRRWNAWTSTTMAFVVGMLFLVGMGAVMNHRSPFWGLVTSSAVVLWIQWALGMLAVEGAVGLVTLPRWTRWLPLVPVWIAAAALADRYVLAFSPLGWGLVFFTLVNWAVTKEQAGAWRMTRVSEWVRRTGVISYSIYLTHWPAVYVSFLVIRGVFGKGALTPNAPEYLAQLAFMFVFSYGVGWAFFQLVERHFLNTRDAAVAAGVPRHASVVSEAM